MSYYEKSNSNHHIYYGENFKETVFITNFKSIYSQEFGLIEFLSYNEFINYVKSMKDFISTLYVSDYNFKLDEISMIDSTIKI